MIAESVGAKVGDCLRLVMQDASHIYVGLKQSVANDFVQLHNGTCTGSINEAQKAIWGEVLFPSRPHAIIEVSRLNQVGSLVDSVMFAFLVDMTFWRMILWRLRVLSLCRTRCPYGKYKEIYI